MVLFVQKINYDDRRLEWKGVQSKRHLTKSTLFIPKAERSDGGTYTCVDTNNVTRNIFLHILDSKYEKIQFLVHCFKFFSNFLSRHVSLYFNHLYHGILLHLLLFDSSVIFSFPFTQMLTFD